MIHSCVDIPVMTPLIYHLTGKFVAPSGEWSHQNSELTDFELIIMTKGSLYLEYHNTCFTVEEGDYLLLPPFDAPDNHRRGFKPSDCSFYWLHFLPAHPHTYLRTIPPFSPNGTYPNLPEDNLRIPIQGKLSNADKLIVLMKQLQNDVRIGYPALSLNYESSIILCELYNQLCMKNVHPDGQRSQKQIYSDIVDYVKLNTSINLRVSDVAAHFGYNEKYLSHLFNKVSGVPLKQFILKCKMDDANFLLTDTNLTIGEIAQRLGYGDAHNFTRAYKKISGLSPSAYRQAYARRMLFHV